MECKLGLDRYNWLKLVGLATWMWLFYENSQLGVVVHTCVSPVVRQTGRKFDTSLGYILSSTLALAAV